MPSGEEIIPTALLVHKYLKRVGAYKRVQNFLLRRTAYPILILGATGVGKTSFCKSLFGEIANISRENRSDDNDEIIGQIEKKVFLKLIDTPGEKSHEAKRKTAIREAMKFGSLGIINVVAFGLHEGKFSKRDAVNRQSKPSATFLKSRRKAEIELLAEWANVICGEGGPADWVTTVVTKADLWWENTAEQPVIQYYESDRYTPALGNAKDIPHTVKPYCSMRHLFYDSVPMSGYYSDRKAEEHHAQLIAHILDKASRYG
jgi:hypothetical protein